MSASSVCAQNTPINKRPLNDFGTVVKEKIDRKEIDTAAPFSIELSGNLGPDGKLDKTTKFGKTEGNPQNVELAKQGLAAINETGVFEYLRQISTTSLKLTVSQNTDQFSFIIKSSVESDSRAKAVVSGLNLVISMLKLKIKSPEKANRVSDLLLLNGTKVTADGKEISISFQVPAGEFQQMITRELNNLNRTSGND